MHRKGEPIAMLIAIGIFATSGPASSWAAEPDAGRNVRTVPGDAYRRTETLTLVTLGFGVLHHTDHVVRDNHSGFPFTSHLTPFTPTLIVYPLVLGGLALDAGPLYWTIFDAAAFVGVIAVHITLEPLPDVYTPWADGTNLIGTRSPTMGVVALTILGGLTLGLGASLVSSIGDGRRYGFTWKRRPAGTAIAPGNFAFTVTPDGQLMFSFRW
jgi:hypothetical protein